MHTRWAFVSKQLERKVCDEDGIGLIVEALLDAKDNDETANEEKSHWWKFLSKLANRTVDDLKYRARTIRERIQDSDQREVEYCKLVRIPPHQKYYASPQVQTSRRIEGGGWDFRWIFTYTDEKGAIQKKPGWKLTTINTQRKSGEIQVNEIFKRATYIPDGVRNGTATEENSADDWIVCDDARTRAYMHAFLPKFLSNQRSAICEFPSNQSPSFV